MLGMGGIHYAFWTQTPRHLSQGELARLGQAGITFPQQRSMRGMEGLRRSHDALQISRLPRPGDVAPALDVHGEFVARFWRGLDGASSTPYDAVSDTQVTFSIKRSTRFVARQADLDVRGGAPRLRAPLHAGLPQAKRSRVAPDAPHASSSRAIRGETIWKSSVSTDERPGTMPDIEALPHTAPLSIGQPHFSHPQGKGRNKSRISRSCVPKSSDVASTLHATSILAFAALDCDHA
jgi:hypothetical protein